MPSKAESSVPPGVGTQFQIMNCIGGVLIIMSKIYKGNSLNTRWSSLLNFILTNLRLQIFILGPGGFFVLLAAERTQGCEIVGPRVPYGQADDDNQSCWNPLQEPMNWSFLGCEHIVVLRGFCGKYAMPKAIKENVKYITAQL